MLLRKKHLYYKTWHAFLKHSQLHTKSGVIERASSFTRCDGSSLMLRANMTIPGVTQTELSVLHFEGGSGYWSRLDIAIQNTIEYHMARPCSLIPFERILKGNVGQLPSSSFNNSMIKLPKMTRKEVSFTCSCCVEFSDVVSNLAMFIHLIDHSHTIY